MEDGKSSEFMPMVTGKKAILDFTSDSKPKFSELKDTISKESMEAIDTFGFTHMTEIQAKAIPPLLEGKDLRGTAKTGSGKTLAFVLPAIELLRNLKFKNEDGIGLLILCPTRELTFQTHAVMRVFADRHGLSQGLVTGGVHRKTEMANLRKGVNCLVGTPGRVLDHLRNTKGVKFSSLKCLVLDEADRMLKGFEEEMKVILKILPKQRQTMLFSATTTKQTDRLATLSLKVTMVDINVDSDKERATVDNVKEYYLVCAAEQRFIVLHSFLKDQKDKKVMVFLSSCDAVKFYHDVLNAIKFPVQCIHGKMKQKERTSVFYEFSAQEGGVLLCTDVAARGWDIPAVEWIIQYDPPEDPSEYIHRVGRTARAGKHGKALLFLQQEELPFVRFLKENKVKVTRVDMAEEKIVPIQKSLEYLINRNNNFANAGRSAFRSYINCYMKHKHKNIFNIKNLDIKKVARAFGFEKAPTLDINFNTGKRKGGGQNFSKNKKFKFDKK